MKNKKLLIFIVAILIIIVFLVSFKSKILKLIYPKKYEDIISIYSREYDVEENLIFAVIKAESNFQETALSHKKAIGLMQIMEETAIDVVNKYDIKIDETKVREEISNVENNINIGTKYLEELLTKYGNKEIAVAAYNAGIGTVDGWIEKGIISKDGSNIENIPYKETNNYVRKILKNYKTYEELYK